MRFAKLFFQAIIQTRYNDNSQVVIDYQDYSHFMFLFDHIRFKADMDKNGYLEKNIYYKCYTYY